MSQRPDRRAAGATAPVDGGARGPARVERPHAAVPAEKPVRRTVTTQRPGPARAQAPANR